MSTSQKKSVLSELRKGEPIPPHVLAYFQARLRNRLFNFVLRKFVEAERSGKLTKAELARRIGRRPEIVTRVLGAPGNWTLDTISDLVLGIAAEELEPASSSLLNRPRRNYSGNDWDIRAADEVDQGTSKSEMNAEFELAA